MSDPVELGFRQRLAAAFDTELDGRVYENVAPPDATIPMATYRRVSTGEAVKHVKTARLQIIVYDDSYTDVKRLQKQIEAHLGDLRGTWLSETGVDCPVWVYRIKPYTMADGYQPATKRRAAISEFEIKYADA